MRFPLGLVAASMTCVLACAFLALFLCSSKIIAELAKNTGGDGVGIVFDTANYFMH